MRKPIQFIAACVALSAVMTAQAQHAQHAQGPNHTNKTISVEGDVIAHGAPYFKHSAQDVERLDCAMVRVTPTPEWTGGRVWVCGKGVTNRYPLQSVLKVRGAVQDTRMTRIGPRMRAAPLLVNPSIQLKR